MSAVVVRLFCPQPPDRLVWICCPACGAKLARADVVRGVIELKCPQRGCRRIVTLTSDRVSLMSVITRRSA